MRVLIVGKDSNLTRQLCTQHEAAKAISGRQLATEPDILDQYAGEPIRVIINAFRPATLIRDNSNAAQYIQQSLGPVTALLDKLTSLDVQKIVYTSTAAVYGNQACPVESDSPSPRDLYAAAKLTAEKLVSQRSDSLGIPCTILRVFNMYGGTDTFSVVYRLLEAVRRQHIFPVANEGRAVRDFIHVNDVASVALQVLGGSAGRMLNVGTGRGTSIADLVELVHQSGLHFETTPVCRDEIENSIANVDELQKLLNPGRFRDIRLFVPEQLRNLEINTF